MPGPIAGIKIVDLSTLIVAPYATQILADMGAEVIEVGGPTVDSLRCVQPSRHPHMSGVTMNFHRNKRNITLDLKNPDGLEVFMKLIAGADVFIHNMRYQAIRNLGLEYSVLKRRNPNIIYCSAYGFSRKGMYRDRPAMDDVIQAGSGIASLYTRSRGHPDYYPGAVCDKVAGMTAAYAILGGLLGRAMGRGGQEIEVPMFETAVAFNLSEMICAHAFDPPLGDFGWKRILSPNRKPYKTKDGYMCLMPYTDDGYKHFFTFIGQPELADKPEYRTHPSRINHTDELYAIIEEAAKRFTTDEWMEFCNRTHIAAMPVNDLEKMWDDPHLKATGLLGVAEHPTEGRYKVIGSPITYFSTPQEITRHAPRPGQHTAEVLAELGYAPAEVEQLLASRAAITEQGLRPQLAPAE